MHSKDKQFGAVLSIGYGDRPWNDFMQRLRSQNVAFVVDVRSRPRSRQPEFNREALDILLAGISVRYLFMGDALGGRPDDLTVYVDGKVDYERCKQRSEFQTGLDRIVAAYEGGYRVAVMCSELDPERCHRSKLIGEALKKRHVPLSHIDRDGSITSQEEVIKRITGGQQSLFDNGFTSIGRYEPQGFTE